MDMVRDFSDDAKAQMYRYIDDVTPEPGDFGQGMLDWFFNTFADPTLDWDYGDIDAYHKDVLNKFDTSKEQIDAIFAAAEQVDAEYAARFRQLLESMAKAAEDVNRLAALWDDGAGNHLIFGSPEAFAAHVHANFNVESGWDHALQRRVLALLDDPRFSQERWDSLDEEGKKAFLNELLAEVQAIMGTSALPEIRFGVPEDPNWRAWRGNTDSLGIFCVCINEGVLDLSREDLMRTVFHETRHVYQAEVFYDQGIRSRVTAIREDRVTNHPTMTLDVTFKSGLTVPADSVGPLRHPQTSDATAIRWRDDPIINHHGKGTGYTFMDYVGSTVEYDAWNFAGQFRDAVEPRVTGWAPETWPGANYEGSWGADNAWLNGS